jgi:membrane protein DedA with SNARE-associated domain
VNEFIHTLSQLDPLWIYLTILIIAYIENLFPPAPSDILVVFGGALAAMGKGHFVLAILAGTIGGTLGFMTMFWIGKWFGRKILEQGKIKFVKLEQLHIVEKWFRHYGFWVIVGNRFLTGTRAVVSFFAGISELNFISTSLLSFISSLMWYSILVYLGNSLGHNWERIGEYLATYSYLITGIFIMIALIIVVRFLILKKNNRKRAL